MEKRIIKKILAIFMIITILATDFFVLGSSLITYASSRIETETNESNIEFSAYLKNEEGEKIDTIEKSIKSGNIKLYANIAVKNEGYFSNATIKLNNSGFDLISASTGKLEGDKLILNQIGEGQALEVELNLEPIFTDKMPSNMLLETTVELEGTYVSSENEEGATVKANRNVSVKYLADTETIEWDLWPEIISNEVVAVNGTNKRIVQMLIKSGIIGNQYPVEYTKIQLDVPQLSQTAPEETSVMAIGKLATNGLTKISSDDWTIENGKLQINIKNQPDGNNQITWSKNVYDEMIVTFIYPEDVDASTITTVVNSEIKVYNLEQPYTKDVDCSHSGDLANDAVMSNTQITTSELYKGQLYANITATEKQDIQYETLTTLVVTKEGIVNEIKINETQDEFVTEGIDVVANTKYISTIINKDQMLNILGQDGSVTLKNGDTEIVLTKTAEVDGNGNIVIEHKYLINQLEITTTKPVKTGLLEVRHTKAITGTYTRKQIKAITTLKSGNANIEMQETVSRADLAVITEGNLSTTETNNLTLGVVLITKGEEYDFYKNPTITIQLPSVVETVEFNTTPTIQNVNNNEITISDYKYNQTTKEITIKLEGEQTTYPGGDLSELYIPLDLKVTLSKLGTTQNGKITMTFTNQNASKYYGSTNVVEKTIGIVAPSGLLKWFNLNTNSNTSTSEETIERVLIEEAGKTLDFEITLLNNTGSDINNVNVLGKLPTTVDSEDTLETVLKNITASNGKVYYTENTEATVDVNDDSNGWTESLTSNAKLYLIKLDSLNNGSNYTATLKIQIPNNIQNGQKTYTEYQVIYGLEGETKTERSRRIRVVAVSELETQLTAQVGKVTLNRGDKVKEGEVIKYTATVTNYTEQTLENVVLKAGVPEGTVALELSKGLLGIEGGYVYQENVYYDELHDVKEIVKIIPTLNQEETYTMEYEVRVKSDIKSGTEISNKAIATYNEKTTESFEMTNILEEANVRVTIKRTDDISKTLVAGSTAKYNIFIENISNETVKNLKMEIVSDTYNVERVDKEGQMYLGEATFSNIEIPANGVVNFDIYGKIIENTEEHLITAVVTDSNWDVYRANVVVEQLPKIDAQITMSSTKTNKNIKQGDIVEYTIKAKNTGDYGNIIEVKDQIPSCMEIQSISINGEIYLQSTDETKTDTYLKGISNNRNHILNAEPRQEGIIKIKAKVLYIPIEDDGKTITNVAEVSVNGVTKDTAEVTHILKANIQDEAEIKNIISGYVWADENKNGKMDSTEIGVKDVKVKLYNISSQYYLVDEELNIIKESTDNDGKYRFTNIPNGSYKIVFEYDTEKYEYTTYLAEGVDSNLNSKVTTGKVTIAGEEITVTSTDTIEVQDNVFNINMGLIEKGTTTPGEGEEEKPGENVDKKSISGLAWLDANQNGQKDNDEIVLPGIKVKLYNVATDSYLTETRTDANGNYTFSNIEKGLYILVFEYDKEEYEPTTYLASGVDTSKNSKVVLKKITINGKEQTLAATDTIDVQENVYNINIGLKEKLVFDLELNKYISRIVVQTNKKTKTYDYKNSTFEKVEIHRKQLQGSLVVLEYTIKVKNNGEITGYAKNIVDYLPSGLTFSSELNKDWYLSGNYLYTKSLENIELKPGEEKEVKLVLTKTMTAENIGLINNRAEIYQDYNNYGNIDIDSTPNNQAQGEDDIGSVDVIIAVSTGGSIVAYIMLMIINIILIGIAIRLMIKNNIIKIRRERR